MPVPISKCVLGSGVTTGGVTGGIIGGVTGGVTGGQGVLIFASGIGHNEALG